MFDSDTDTCLNVVVSVKYEFIWDADKIDTLQATFVLADLPLERTLTVNIQYRRPLIYATYTVTLQTPHPTPPLFICMDLFFRQLRQ